MKKLILILVLFSALKPFAQNTDSVKTNHSNRYLFAPSAFSLEKREYRYSTYFFMVHDVQYGFSDYFNLTIGGSIILNPIYIMPSFSYKINNKSALIIGDLFIYPIFEDLFPFNGNLLYGMYTYGNTDNNISIGGGLWSTMENDMTKRGNSPAVAISGIAKMSTNWYFVTENYGFKMTIKEQANYYNNFNEYIYKEYFENNSLFIGGLSGFRLISKRKPNNYWQFGLIYILSFFDDLPSKYDSPNWEVFIEDDNFEVYLIPILTFSHKF